MIDWVACQVEQGELNKRRYVIFFENFFLCALPISLVTFNYCQDVKKWNCIGLTLPIQFYALKYLLSSQRKRGSDGIEIGIYFGKVRKWFFFLPRIFSLSKIEYYTAGKDSRDNIISVGRCVYYSRTIGIICLLRRASWAESSLLCIIRTFCGGNY